MLTGRLGACERFPPATTGSGDEKLTQRERRVLQLLTSELSERDIGRELYMSHNTVHSHVGSIYRKLGVSSRSGAVQRTRELGLSLTPDGALLLPVSRAVAAGGRRPGRRWPSR